MYKSIMSGVESVLDPLGFHTSVVVVVQKSYSVLLIGTIREVLLSRFWEP